MFRRPFSFQGRIRRLEYAITVVVLVTLNVIIGVAFSPKFPPWQLALVALLSVWLFVAQGVKRCHDLGKRWWWCFDPVFVLRMLFARGEHGVNEFGPVPKEKASISH
ncbi:MAG: DUF805 domain-containing protein [Flavobacteriales bacterium]|jgi:uncharacterized membrane protein YhaH (DUF805 family)